MSKILLIEGDGIGPEVVSQAQRVLEAVADRHGLALEYDEALLGGALSTQRGAPARGYAGSRTCF